MNVLDTPTHDKTLSKFTTDHESELLRSISLIQDPYMIETTKKLYKATKNH